MHCLFHPDLKRGIQKYLFTNENIKHLKALRLKVGERIMITNGRGLSLVANINSIQNNLLVTDEAQYFENYGELGFKICAGIAILENRDRFEFALEKCIELGAKEFLPLISKNCEKSIINRDRLIAKSIASLKQSQRSELIKILPPTYISDLPELFNNYDSIFLADYEGEIFDKQLVRNTNLILVGPEGGFSQDEINFIKKNPKTKSINLGNRRLRAETAVVTMMALLSASI